MSYDGVTLIKGCQIYTEESKIENGYIKIQNYKIMEYGEMKDLTPHSDINTIEVPASFVAVPGFIDVHIHGVNGADVMDGTQEALNMMARTLPGEGTTSFLATTMTQSNEEIEKALDNIGQYMSKPQEKGVAEIIGAHLEGPFVNKKKAGAQPLEHIVPPNLDLFKKWQELTKNHIRLVTLAPEQPGGLEMVRYLKEQGIIASIGHSDATYNEAIQAMEAGVNHVTHLFNQMTGLHHREPGVAGAALLRKELMAEMIADGIHVVPEMIDLAYRLKGSKGITLITDSMRAKCLKNGHYDLGGQDVTVGDGKAVLADGTLAGSILKLGSAVKNIMEYTDCSISDGIQMASINPAQQLNIFDRKGSIAKGKDADIVILNEDLDVVMTFCRGTLAYKREEN